MGAKQDSFCWKLWPDCQYLALSRFSFWTKNYQTTIETISCYTNTTVKLQIVG